MGKRAVYPGMFDPMHNGHLDLIERSLRIFDELIVAVVANPSKEPLFTVKERLEMIDECTTGIGMSRMRMTSLDLPCSASRCSTYLAMSSIGWRATPLSIAAWAMAGATRSSARGSNGLGMM